MNCHYCGKLINNNETFCPKCGNRLSSYTITSNVELNDTKEIDTYIDKNINKLKSNRISLPSLFLGSFYYLYRKMYLLALLILSLSIAYSIGINYIPDDYKLYVSIIYLIFSILISIVIAIKFNSIYITHANKKISKIKNKYKNSTRFEIIKRIKYSGSTNILSPILAFILIIGINYLFNYKFNNALDKLSNATYTVIDGYRETDAIINLNEDKSFIWYSNKNDKSDNFYVGKYKVYVGNSAIREAKRYKLYTDKITDKNNYYIIKLNITSQSINGKLSNTNTNLIYSGLYDNNLNSIDLMRLGDSDYFRLVKVK